MTHNFPWQGGWNLISLRDMKEYLARRLLKVAHNLVKLQTVPKEQFSASREDCKRYAKKIRQECEFLGLPCTRRQSIRVGAHLNDILKSDNEIKAAADELSQRFDDETEALKLFYVPIDKIDYYNKTDLFGEVFKSKFPKANSEIIEAGNCFAFDRFSACAYHLTRALEIVLRAVFVSLGMQPRIWSVTKWKNLCDRIDAKIKKNNQHRANDAVWQENRPFFEKAHTFLTAARAPLRNATVHVDVVYPDEGSVHPVWLATEAFMRHIAEKLTETS